MSPKLPGKQEQKNKKQASIKLQGGRITKFRQFLYDVEPLKKAPIKLKGLDSKTVESLGVSQCTPQEFLAYYSTFQMKFAEKCQKKWSKKDKAMLLWVIVRLIQKQGKKNIEELHQEDYEELADIIGIKKQVIIQQVSQILCLKTSKNPFSEEEKEVLSQLVSKYEGRSIDWNSVAQQFNNSLSDHYSLRTIKSLKQVFSNHLNPHLNKSAWTPEEDIKLISLIRQFGKKWQMAANQLSTRNQCQVKNEYYKLLREQMHLAKIPASKKLDVESELTLLENYQKQLQSCKSQNLSNESTQTKLDLDEQQMLTHSQNYEKFAAENDDYSDYHDEETQIHCSNEDNNNRNYLEENNCYNNGQYMNYENDHQEYQEEEFCPQQPIQQQQNVMAEQQQQYFAQQPNQYNGIDCSSSQQVFQQQPVQYGQYQQHQQQQQQQPQIIEKVENFNDLVNCYQQFPNSKEEFDGFGFESQEKANQQEQSQSSSYYFNFDGDNNFNINSNNNNCISDNSSYNNNNILDKSYLQEDWESPIPQYLEEESSQYNNPSNFQNNNNIDVQLNQYKEEEEDIFF